MKTIPTSIALAFLFAFSCIGEDIIDDFVEPVLRITNPVTSFSSGANYVFEVKYFDNVGDPVENVDLIWESSDTDVLTINNKGEAIAKSPGDVTITVKVNTEEGLTVLNEYNITITNNVVTDPPPVEEPPTGQGTNTLMASVSISNPISSIVASSSYTFETVFTNIMGEQVSLPNVEWTSSDPNILTVDNNGLIEAIAAGTVSVSVTVQVSGTLTVTDQTSFEILPSEVVNITSFSGTIATTSSYALKGSFVLEETEDGLTLSIAEDYVASTALPGLYIYLSNNPNTTSGAYEIGAVKVFKGSHSYLLPSSIKLMDYKYILYWCKPFNVPVGEAKIY